MKSLVKTISGVMLTFFISLSAYAERGGMSGGGGGTTDPGKVDTNQIRFAVIDSKILINSWMNGEEYLYKVTTLLGGYAPIERQLLLFEQDQDVFNVLNKLKIEVLEDKPCLDAEGNAVDGSIYSSTPDAICISAFSLSKKLNDYNYEIEVAALIIHEIAHLLGADEGMATLLQKLSLFDLKETSILNEKIRLENRLLSDFKYLYQDSLFYVSKSVNHKRTCFELQRTNQEMFRLYSDINLVVPDLSALRAEDREELLAYFEKLDALTEYACSVDEREDDAALKDWFKKEYEKGFAGKSQVTSYEYEKNSYPTLNPRKRLKDTMINKVDSKDGFINEATEISDYIYQVVIKLREASRAEFPVIN